MRNKNYIKVYNRLVKYPMFPVTPVKKTAHKVKKGTAVMQSETEVTVYDEEKIYAILYLVQTKQAEITFKEITDTTTAVVIETSLYQIAKLIKNNNYANIIDSLVRVSNLTLVYDVEKKADGKIIKGKAIFHPIYKIEVLENKKIKIIMDSKFYNACISKHFFINVEYFALAGHAKNIYKFLATNLTQKTISLTTISERCLFSKFQKKEQRRILKEALKKIQKTTLAKNYNFKLEKDILHIIPKK